MKIKSTARFNTNFTFEFNFFKLKKEKPPQKNLLSAGSACVEVAFAVFIAAVEYACASDLWVC